MVGYHAGRVRAGSPELPVGGGRTGKSENMLLDRGGQLVEQTTDAAAVEGAEVTGESGGGDRLGLGQVVALGLVGQAGLHHVEGGQVGAVVVGPVHPDPDERARGQVHAGRVLGMAGQDQQRSGTYLRPPRSVGGCLTERPRRVLCHCAGSGSERFAHRISSTCWADSSCAIKVSARPRPAAGKRSSGRRRPGHRGGRPTAGESVGSPQRQYGLGQPLAADLGQRSGRSPVTTTSVHPSTSRSAVSTVWAKAVG